MVEVVTKIIVRGKSPAQISEWLINLTHERYLKWHPAHKSFSYVTRTDNFVGSILYFDETFEAVRIKNAWTVLEFKKNESVLLKASTTFPTYLHLSATKQGDDTEITHRLQFGFSFHGLEKILDWFIRTFILTERKMRALERHAREEFQNLEKII